MNSSSAYPTPSAGSRRCAIVVGAHGQDGRLLCAELERNHYDVTRVGRTTTQPADGQPQPFDIGDAAAVDRLVDSTVPDEIYYLAAYHHSAEESTGDAAMLVKQSLAVHCLWLVNFLSAIQRRRPGARLFYAASSLVFGYPDDTPQNEKTPLRPVCAYGATKLAGMNICDVYRREHGTFCGSGILFNHESPYRSPQFVTRKIVNGAVDIHLGLKDELIVGSLAAQTDWGAAADYVRAMHAMLALPEPGDFVIATGKLRSVRDFAQAAFAALDMDYTKYVREKSDLVQRAIRKVPLAGDASKLTAATGWTPQITFEAMIREMVQHELASRDRAQNQRN